MADWQDEQNRVDALLGTSANGYGSGDPNAQQNANPYAPTGAQSPYIDPNSGQFVDTYPTGGGGYFGSSQQVVDYSQQMLDALHRGDNAAYSAALNQYKQTTGGLQPPWSYNITPDQVAMNSRNPGGVNAGQPAYNVQMPSGGTAETQNGGQATYQYGQPGQTTPPPPAGNTTPKQIVPLPQPISPPPGGTGAGTQQPGDTIGLAPNQPGGGGVYPAATTGGAVGGANAAPPATPNASLGNTQQAGISAPYGSTYQPPAFDPNKGLDPIYYGYQIGQQGNPSLSYIPDLSTNDPNRLYRNVENVSYNYGAGNSAQIGNQQTQQSNLYNQYGQAADQAYSQLAQTPGYTDEETANITREPQYQSGVTSAAGYGSLAPTAAETAGIQGDTASYGNYFNPQQFNDLNQSNENQQYANISRVGGALDTAQGNAYNRMTDALANPALNPTSEYQRQAGMTDAEVEQMANAGARNVGLASAAQQENLRRSLAASGITSPLALAAAQSRVQLQGQTNAADAVVDARLAARQAQRSAATGVQQTQLGAAQYQTGQDLATQQYLANLGSQNALNQGQLTQQAQNQIAANQLASQQYITNTGTSITEAQDAANQARQAQLYGIRQGNTQYQQQNQYNQNMGVQNALSTNYANAAQQRLTGQNQVRGYLTGQQGQALGAQQTAQNQQLTNYNAMTGAMNANAGQWGNYQIGKSSLPAGWQQILGGVAGAAGAATQQSS